MQSDIEATQMIAKLSFNCFWGTCDEDNWLWYFIYNLFTLQKPKCFGSNYTLCNEFPIFKGKKCFNYYDLWLTCRKETKAMLIHRLDKTLSSCVVWQDGVIFLFRKLRYVKGNNSNSYLTSDRATIIVIWWILKWLTHTTVSREILYYNTYL